ncbi:hypothetical protein GCM10007854_22730 [Algimonas porphyrae]|uniref:Lipoprotein n=1 Tax=Algimonas porphyrae TaxID=1128113 RepID=A0ABQ5V187_9PROT|nr:hypothetical protein GCM10007854_22730 [Algimonas porphyrae]
MFLCGAAILVAACSTIDRGVIDHARIDTVPQGASVTLTYITGTQRPDSADIKTQFCRATPCAFPIPRRQIAKVTVTHPDYETAEYMVGPSRLRGSVGVSLSKTLPTAMGVGAYSGVIYATLTQLTAGIANALTFGLGQAQGVSTASGATAGTGVGLAVAAGSMLIDAGTGANGNLFPNPVVLGLTDQKDAPVLDPLVAEYDKWLEALAVMKTACSIRSRSADIRNQCRETEKTFMSTRAAYRAALKERDDALIAFAKEQKKRMDAQADQP